MLRVLAGLGLVAATLVLSGCYLGPDYSYVRQADYQGGAYYGQARGYDGGYYVGPGYAPYGYGYGCCYAPGVSVGVGAVWYDRPRYRYRSYAPPRYHRQFDRRPRAGSSWRDGRGHGAPPGRSGGHRGSAAPGRAGPPRGAAGPGRGGSRHGAAGRHRSQNP